MKRVKSSLATALVIAIVISNIPFQQVLAAENTNSVVTAVDENGNVKEVDGSPKLVENKQGADSKAVGTQIVNFNTKGNATTSYTEVGTGASGYTNGAYGADAAYLGTVNGKVKFMLSGVVGLVDPAQVQVVNLSSVSSYSYYALYNGNLIHYVTTNLTGTTYASSLGNGKAPSYIQSGVKYYSYDGHYFYTNYDVMLADYGNNVRTNAINASSPFYNYYQYLPFRSRSLYSGAELNTVINARTDTGSKMKETGNAFITTQNQYGVNGLIAAGIAANESNWGKSTISQTKNNLFGLNAVDSSPGTSANTYGSITACIEDFANGWMSRGYLNPSDGRYFGGFLGNKASGLNVKYASDPYWGEKAATIAYSLDKSASGKDAYKYTIGIKDTVSTDHNVINIRQNSNTSSAIPYRTSNASSYSVLLLKKQAENGFYKIQSDGVLNSDRSGLVSGQGTYIFETMYAYISSDYVNIVNSGNDISTDFNYELNATNATIKQGSRVGFLALTTDKTGATPTVTSSNASVATVKLVNAGDSRGYYFEAQGVSVGTATLTVTYKGVAKTLALTVEPFSYNLSGTQASVKQGSKLGFLALTTDKTGATPTVTSSNTSVATVKLVNAGDSRGYYFEAQGVSGGTATLTVTYKGVAKTLALTVEPFSYNLSGTQASVKQGSKLGFLALTTDKTGATPTVTSSNTSVATVKLVNAGDSRGYYFEAQGVSGGTATLTVTYKGVAKTLALTVEPFSYELNAQEATITKGNKVGFLALTTDKTGAAPTVTSSNTSVATAKLVNAGDSRGYYFEAEGKDLGSATLTVTYKGVSRSMVINVESFSYNINAKNLSMIEGNRIGFLGVTDDEVQTLPTITSSNENVAVGELVNDKDPRGHYFEVQAKKPGTANITVHYKGMKNTFAVNVEETKVLKGIDVSKYNTSIDWARVKKAGVSFAFIRVGNRGATTGTIVEDPYFKTHIKGALNAGVDVGVYFYTQAVTVEEAKEEARFTYNLIKSYNIKYPVVFDTESFTGGRHNNLTVAQRTAVTRAFCEEIKKLGYTPMIYANKNWLEKSLYMSQLSEFQVWVAQYNSECTYKGNYKCWQYTSSGTVDGISGRVDMNWWYK